MNLKENRHYANEYGVELNEYLKHNFKYEELVGWYTMQVELFTEYDEPKLLELIENWNKFYQIRKTKNS